MRLLRALHADEAGQTVVIVALAFTLLLGFVGLAIDGGRFYAERRFLQTAVDAAALGCVRQLTVGTQPVDAEAWTRAFLTGYSLPGDPTGTGVTVSPLPQRNTWYNSDQNDWRNLYDGVHAGTIDCRVAVQASMQTFFIRLFGVTSISVPANAHAMAKGGMLPVVINRYRDAPGPSRTFIDYIKEEAFQNSNPSVCYENGGRLPTGTCPDAAPGDYSVDLSGNVVCTDCHWGPETVVAGQGYQSSDSDFRGFIALDIRDYSTVDASNRVVHEYYNGADSMGANQLKEQEASYVNGGYPGPDLVAYDPTADPVQKGLQIGTMSGNSAGIVVSNFAQYFRLGEKILVQLFDGQVREVPDFSINQPSVISATSPMGPGADGPTFRVGANVRFRSSSCTPGIGACWVDLELRRDTFNDGANDDTPAGFVETAVTFAPDRFTPDGGSGTQVGIRNLQIGAVSPGIYSVVLRGTGHNAPVPTGSNRTTHDAYVPLNIGNVVSDFAMGFRGTTVEVERGASPTFTFTLTTGSGAQDWGTGNPVTVAIDRGTCALGQVRLVAVGSPIPVCTTATISGSPDFQPRKSGPPTVTVTIPVLPDGAYELVLRARGRNADGRDVVHVQPVTLAVGGASTGGGETYINVQGYAVFVITSVTSNTVSGRAITGYYGDPKDPKLNIAHRPGLIPWEAAPY